MGSYRLVERSSKEKNSERSETASDVNNRIWSNYVNIKEFSDSKPKKAKNKVLDLQNFDGEIFTNGSEIFGTFGEMGRHTCGTLRPPKESAEKQKKSSRKRLKNCRSESKKTLVTGERPRSPSHVFTQKVDRDDLIKWWLLDKFEANAEKIIPA